MLGAPTAVRTHCGHDDPAPPTFENPGVGRRCAAVSTPRLCLGTLPNSQQLSTQDKAIDTATLLDELVGRLQNELAAAKDVVSRLEHLHSHHKHGLSSCATATSAATSAQEDGQDKVALLQENGGFEWGNLTLDEARGEIAPAVDEEDNENGKYSTLGSVETRHMRPSEVAELCESKKKAKIEMRHHESLHFERDLGQCCPLLVSFMRKVVRHSAFRLLNSFMVVVNVIYMGMAAATDLKVATGGSHDLIVTLLLQPMRFVFWGVFTFELICNLIAVRFRIWTSRNRLWLTFDLLVVTFDTADLFMTIVAIDGMGVLHNLTVLRLMRGLKVLRIMRMVKAVKYMQGMRLLLLAIISSVKQLVWAMCLLFCIIYLFAVLFSMCVASYLTTETTLDDHPELISFWGSLWFSSMTLFASMSGGVSWKEPYDSLSDLGIEFQLLFVAYLSFTIFAVLNVVTGVFCNNAIETANNDTEMIISSMHDKRESLAVDLANLFHLLKEDDSGTVNVLQLDSKLNDPEIMAYLTHLQIETDDAWHFFRMLDGNKSHDIDVHEWTAGCLRLRGPARNIDMQVLLKENRRLMQMMSDSMVSMQQSIQQAIGNSDSVESE
eukprot:TRINITY_DN67441_c0_g1_i1.p1 TRINITY_DN67441_c0_g1~~TRINITY_DN67441_c0_g1_i1.p1  ORF type:complete len:638 (-),score=91.10 TRINITY_DN67441_c0_g1_i1:485-2305(-)